MAPPPSRLTAPSSTSAGSLLRARDYPTLVRESLLATALRPAGTRYRAVIAEYEEHLVDDGDPYDTPLERKERRIVFVEHVELT